MLEVFVSMNMAAVPRCKTHLVLNYDALLMSI